MLDTLSNVKARLGITTSADDTFLTAQITLISAIIESYCRRKFAATDWVQTFYDSDYRNAGMLELYHYPLIEIDEIEIDEVESDNTLYRLHLPTARIMRKDRGAILGEEIIVSYSAGYESIPPEILLVLDSLVSERYNKKTAGVDLNFGSDVQRLSIPGAISIDFDYSLANNERKSAYGSVIGNYANILDDWRSERAVIGNGKLEYVSEAEEP